MGIESQSEHEDFELPELDDNDTTYDPLESFFESSEEVVDNSNLSPQDGSQKHPEGVFNVFDKEFYNYKKDKPVPSDDIEKFNTDFLNSFDEMFDEIYHGEDLPDIDNDYHQEPANTGMADYTSPKEAHLVEEEAIVDFTNSIEEHSDLELEEINFDDEIDEIEETEEIDKELFNEFTDFLLGKVDDTNEDKEETPSNFNEGFAIEVSENDDVDKFPDVADEERVFEDAELEFDSWDTLNEDGQTEERFNDSKEPVKNQEDTKEEQVNSIPEKIKKNNSNKKPVRNPFSGILRKILGLLLIPWRLYSKLTSIVFKLLSSVLGALSALPLIGVVFKTINGVVASLPMIVKKILLLIGVFAFLTGSITLPAMIKPSPSELLNLPDSGRLMFTDVKDNGGTISGKIVNNGEVAVEVIPKITVTQRKVFDFSTWFNPEVLNECYGEPVTVRIDETVDVNIACNFNASGSVTLKPELE